MPYLTYLGHFYSFIPYVSFFGNSPNSIQYVTNSETLQSSYQNYINTHQVYIMYIFLSPSNFHAICKKKITLQVSYAIPYATFCITHKKYISWSPFKFNAICKNCHHSSLLPYVKIVTVQVLYHMQQFCTNTH